MKKNILFWANCDMGWMGGVYYIRNQIAQLLSYEPARKNVNVYLYVTEEIAAEYKNLLVYENVYFIKTEEIRKKNFYTYSKRYIEALDADLIYLAFRYRITYIFPYFPMHRINRWFLLRKSISWIPDFQHIHYPRFFTNKECWQRERRNYEIARNYNKLVLSSYDAYHDFTKKYGNESANIYIIPFCSMLDKREVIKNEIEETKSKYGIEGNYFIVCNQFWQHKNHMIVFEALSQIILYAPNIKVVCTGSLQDYRNREYIAKIRNYIIDQNLDEAVFLLGLIPKEDQIQLMKGAVAVIQPSLFEGWGTVVEDAKTLGKKVLMSDIAVHREQKNGLCTLFDPHNEEELANKMYEVWDAKETEKVSYYYSVKSGRKYGKMFYKMINNAKVQKCKRGVKDGAGM